MVSNLNQITVQNDIQIVMISEGDNSHQLNASLNIHQYTSKPSQNMRCDMLHSCSILDANHYRLKRLINMEKYLLTTGVFVNSRFRCSFLIGIGGSCTMPNFTCGLTFVLGLYLGSCSALII